MTLLTLPDGRTLAYREWGDPAGTPVFYLHGTPGCHLERYPDDKLTTALGVRLITHDRAGYGRTGRLAGRTVRDCTPDLVALADHLGIQEFALAGISGGGPFVLHACHALPDRVRRAAVSACPAPLDVPGAYDGMNPTIAEELHLAAACLASGPARLERYFAERSPDAGLPEADLLALRQIPGFAEMLTPGIPEWTRQGWAGAADDDIAFAAPWGFDPAEITVPVAIWHGEADTMVPFHHGQRLAATIPTATLHPVPTEAHVAMFAHQPEVLTWLIS